MTINEALEVLRKEYGCRTAESCCDSVFKGTCEGCEYYSDFRSITDALKTVLDAFGNCSELPNSSGDCISRQAAIDALNVEKLTITGETRAKAVYNYILMVIDKLKFLPSVQAEQKWIPCKDNMPGPDKLVIMQCRGKKWPSGYRYFQTLGVWIPPLTVKSEDKWSSDFDTEDLEVYDVDTDTYYCKSGWYEETTQGDGDNMSWEMTADVIAWMPRPATYRGDTDGKRGGERDFMVGSNP